jgi:hypothetical protein
MLLRNCGKLNVSMSKICYRGVFDFIIVVAVVAVLVVVAAAAAVAKNYCL